jgi:hypothetical protein
MTDGTLGRRVHSEIECQGEERIGKTIVGSGFGRQDMAKVGWNMFNSKFAAYIIRVRKMQRNRFVNTERHTNDGCTDDRVRWGKASRDGETRDECELGKECLHHACGTSCISTCCSPRVELDETQTCNDDPSKRHGRHHHHRQTLDVLPEISLWKLHTDSEQPSGQYNTHDFQGDLVLAVAPGARVKGPCNVWTHENTECRSEHDFIQVKLRGIGSVGHYTRPDIDHLPVL